ncbi:MAG: ribosome small subunit-dependent GTPase A [Vampirovibrionales bacterium]|nr:ribosome small subunit-dependent GTPase A [Vampirovibrionales bacterium]
MPPESNHLPDAPVGRVIASHSDRHTVEYDGRRYECALRGLLRKTGVEALCGDWVALDRLDDINGAARIVEILPRRVELARPRVANIDQVLIVHSVLDPAFNDEAVERLLIRAALCGIDALLCLSKQDLAPRDAIDAIAHRYEDHLNTPAIKASIRDPDTLTALVEALTGKVTALAGPSGVGKSSLLNALNPALRLRVADVSGKIGRGRHTTRHAALLEVRPHAWVADTPGFSNLKFTDTLPPALERAFHEFAAWRPDCAFANCLHLDEIDCAVRAQSGGELDRARYERYCVFQAEARECAERLKRESAKSEYGLKRLDAVGRGRTREEFRLKGKNREASRRVHRQRAVRDSQTETAHGEAFLEDVE